MTETERMGACHGAVEAFFVIGWRDSAGGGATLYLAAYRETALVIAGSVEVDLSGAAGRRLKTLMARIRTRKPEVHDPGPPSGVQWLQPVLIADVGFEGVASDGKIVAGVYRGLRRRQDNADVFRVSKTE
ncbi:ATP-dependent DNA ligase [compost metagenome]